MVKLKYKLARYAASQVERDRIFGVVKARVGQTNPVNIYEIFHNVQWLRSYCKLLRTHQSYYHSERTIIV